MVLEITTTEKLGMPSNIGSWTVTVVDKIVATYECLKFKMPIKMGALFIFLLNIFFVQR